MKRMKQGYKDRLDESIGMRHPHHDKQPLKDRRHESESMEKKDEHHPYSADKSMDEDYHHHMAHAHHRYMAHKHRKKMHKR